MSRNLFFSTWFTCSIHINKKIYIKIELHNVIYILNSTNLENLEDESDAF